MKTTILLTAVMVSSLYASANSFPERIQLNSEKIVSVKPDPVFNAFRAHRQGKGITTMWFSSSTPATVTSFTVIRTYEDPTDPYAEWTVVGSMNCNSSRNYRNTDDGVSPGFVSYRVVASLAAGGYVYSDIETVHIVQH